MIINVVKNTREKTFNIKYLKFKCSLAFQNVVLNC